MLRLELKCLVTGMLCPLAVRMYDGVIELPGAAVADLGFQMRGKKKDLRAVGNILLRFCFSQADIIEPERNLSK